MIALAWWIVFTAGCLVCLAAGLALAGFLLACAGNYFWRKTCDIYTFRKAWIALHRTRNPQDSLLGDDK